MKIKVEDVGEEYLEELEIIIKIRKQRRKIYGDSFLDNNTSSLLNLADGKINRVKNIIKLHTLKHPKIQDEIIDIINYYFFILIKLKKGDFK